MPFVVLIRQLREARGNLPHGIVAVCMAVNYLWTIRFNLGSSCFGRSVSPDDKVMEQTVN